MTAPTAEQRFWTKVDKTGGCWLWTGGVQHGYGRFRVVSCGRREYAHRYAQGTATYGGTTDVYRNIIAEHYLGLPRSRPSTNTKPPVG